ncbi:unnamed protein product, partial [Prunus brigantina]
MTRPQPTSPPSSSSSPVHIQTRNSSSHRHFFKHFHTNPKPFMEITSFPFLSQEDYSHIFTLFPDMDDFDINGEGGLKKRRRKEEDGNNNNGPMSDILTTLILLDEEEKQEQEEFFVQTQQ